MKNIFSEKKYVIALVSFIVLVLVWVWFYFWFVKYNQNIEAKKAEQVKNINIVLDSNNYNFDNCSVVIDFDKSLVLDNQNFADNKYNNFKEECISIFDIKNINLNEDNCVDIIKNNKSYFNNSYLVLDEFDNIKDKCSQKFLTAKFSVNNFFDVENNFKSDIAISFGMDFFSDIWEENSKEFIDNRIEAKKRLKDLILIEPKVDFTIDDIVLYNSRVILSLDIKELTEYKIWLKNYTSKNDLQTNNEEFVFSTPENKYFWIKLNNKVSLYQDNKTPKFSLLEYNSDKTKTKLKICRIPNETYAKIEVFRKRAETEAVEDFFLNDIDSLENFDCKEKELDFSNLKDEKNTFVKMNFDFDDIIWNPSRSWLYFVTFSDKNDRKFNDRINYPIFFGIIDSHITAKISKNSEAFFFVNDFNWKPLAKQNIRLYFNDFEEINKTRNDEKRDYDITYKSALDNNVFSESINLWTTWADWILKVNLKEISKDPYVSDKLRSTFSKTFESDWSYSWNGLYDTFFITSASDTNLTYLNSTWNSWIAPYNFWYKILSDYYWWEDKPNQDAISLDRWGSVEPDYYSHIYTDRLLYLPWETVNIKSVIRKSSDLSILENKEVELVVTDSKNKEILKETLKISEFGSISKSLNLDDNAVLWNYNITLLIDENHVVSWGFSVEVFKNPKFKNDITLTASWLNDWLVKIDKQETKKRYRYDENIYEGSFKINASVVSKYYNWAVLKDVDFKYKVYKQYYYDNSYWDDCYYGCYWEPEKEFYTQWQWTLDSNWIWTFDIDIDFSSSYNDYKYIVEVTVTDKIWDKISWSNSIIARLPDEYKRYNNDSNLFFESSEKFIKLGYTLVINWWLNIWKWTDDYNDKNLFIIKKKEYENIVIDDIRWDKRNIVKSSDKIEKVLLVNDKNFTKTSEWKLKLNYKLEENWEYTFEYWRIKIGKEYDITKIVDAFNEQKKSLIELEVDKQIEVCKKEKLSDKEEVHIDDKDRMITTDDCETITTKENKSYKLADIYSDKKYFSVLTYWDQNSSVPVYDDNKIKVIPEKISYKLWEKAKILVRLPFSKWKILLTIEKSWVVKNEYIDVVSNTFFKEIVVDDTFVPNAYIWVVAIEVDDNKVPEYKVWYSEIVVDKTDKKSDIIIKTDKKTYAPRNKVNLEVQVLSKDKKPIPSELTVMVVDDSLISLLWNVDLNSLEKFYKKLPFSIQTSITNIAMLKNYYFSRPWIVWWSWFGNFKWWDSAVSSRNIFKNTAYFNPSVITDKNGKAKIEFELPDNLTNFRVMVVWNSKNNFFGYSEDFIEVRQNVIIEDKTPLILRDSDISVIWANIFNNTPKDIWFKVTLDTDISVVEKTKNIQVKANSSKEVYWTIKMDNKKQKLDYKITALWDSAINSDKIENSITYKESPVLLQNIIKNSSVDNNSSSVLKLDLSDPNIDFEKSKIDISFSNNRLDWIEKIVNSLAIYPYWCIEQTVSSTLPNVILKNFDNLLSWIIPDNKKIDENIEKWVSRILWMQTSDWWFWYWPWDTNSNLTITPYVLKSLIYMKESWVKIPEESIKKTISYLEINLKNKSLSELDKAEIFFALSKSKIKINITLDTKNLDRHTLLAYTYWLLLSNNSKLNQQISKNIELIKTKLSSNTSNRYRNNISDKAIFASMLIDADYDRDYIDSLVSSLYDNDWSSYYYSTQSKNNAFELFAKYIKKYFKNDIAKFDFELKKYKSDIITLWWKNDSFYKKSFNLSELAWEDDKFLELTTKNITWDKIFINFNLSIFPKDKLKVKAYSNEIKVKKDIYEVIDENDTEDKCNWDDWNYKCIQAKWLKLVEWNIFKKWVMYKAKLTVNFPESKNRRNLTIEDYLPWAFRVINTKFQTEQISSKENNNYWTFDHKELHPDVVMLNASNVWSDSSSYEYFFRPEFSWVYTMPPITAYMMYEPSIRANTEFRLIEVK